MLVKNDLSQKYINLLKKSLVGELYFENEWRLILTLMFLFHQRKFTFPDVYNVNPDSDVYRNLKAQKDTGNSLTLTRRNPDGSIVPVYEMRNFTELAHTMIGMRRMDNIQYCIEKVLDDNIAGDLIETGVWRGGASIFARPARGTWLPRQSVITDSLEG